jgi:branched-chain amino acid transport system substrate-binding protein
MHVHRSLRLALASVVVLGLTAGSTFAQEPLRIGAVNPYSGPLALYGDELARGYQIAVEERNAKGGVLGRKIELVRGDATNPQQGIAAVDQLVTREKVDVLIGTYISAVSNAASDAALRHQKLYWDTNAIAAELTERKLPNFVRSGPHGAYFAEMSVRAVGEIAKALGKQPKDVTVWLEHEDSIYGKTIVEVQKKALDKAGVKVLGVGSHNFKAADLTDVVLRAKRANPDIWVQTGYVPDGNLMLRTAREQGYKPAAMLWVGTGDTFETLDALGPEYLEGLFVVSYPRPDMSEKYAPGAGAYLATYRKTYNRDPIAPQGFAAYVGMRMLLDAVQEAGSTDPAKVRAAAAKMDKPFGAYPTGFGTKFDESFQNTRAFPTVIQWQAGKQVTVFPVEARSEGTVLKNVPRKQ